MNLCIPVEADQGLQSPVCAHFGSAPLFLFVDLDKDDYHTKPNQHLHDGHGGCMPLRALDGEAVDGLIVGGIGMGAINKLRAGGIRVFLSDQPTVELTIQAYKDGKLREANPANACNQHGHGHDGGGGCGH
jgi:predicted Fe-Mo cluster-binding NifX family protein